MMSAMRSRAAWTSGEKHLTPLGATPFAPAVTAALTRASRFLLCSAETSSTGTLNIWESRLASMTSPRSVSRSHMLRPTTTGAPASNTCVVR